MGPGRMRKVLLVLVLIGTILGASLWPSIDFSRVQPILLEGECPARLESEKSSLSFVSEGDHQSVLARIPTVLQLAIFFDFLRPKESLRVRTLCKYFQRLIDGLLDHRLSVYNGQLKAILPDKLQRLKFSCNYLPLFRVVYPVLPLQRTSLALASLDLIGLILVAVFANCELSVFLDLVASLADRWVRSFRDQNIIFLFKIHLAIKSASNRFAVFKELSELLHENRWPLSLEALYYYCKMKGNEASKLALLWDRLQYFQAGDPLLLDEYFSTVSPQAMWSAAMKSKNGAALDAVLTAFPLLSIGDDTQSILLYLARNSVYSWKVVRERIDWPAVEAAQLDELLPILISDRSNVPLLRDVLQLAPNLNSFYQLLKRIIHQPDETIDWSSVDSDTQQSVVLALASLRYNHPPCLEAFQQLLPFVTTQTAPLLTYFLLDQDPSEYFTIAFSMSAFQPTFISPAAVQIIYQENRLHFLSSPQSKYQLSRIIRLLERRVLSCWWLQSVHFLILGSQVNDYYFSSSCLLRLKENLDGGERVVTSIPELQARYGLQFDGYISDGFAINKVALLERQEWTVLELAVVLANPTAVFLCLLSPQTRAWLESDENAKNSVLKLAQLIKNWVQGDEMVARLDAINNLLAQTIINNNWHPRQLKLILEPRTSATPNGAPQPDSYLILDESPAIRYETKTPH